MSSNRTLVLSVMLVGAMASLASCSDDDDLLNRAPDADAGASSLGGASSTGLGGRGGSTAVGGSGGVTTGPATTTAGGATTAVGGTTAVGSAGTAAGLGGVGGITSVTTLVSTGGVTVTAGGASAIGGAAVAGASGHAGMAGNPNQAGASGLAGAAGAPQKSPLELACEAVCGAQSTLTCALSNCPSECATFGAAVDDPDAYLAMVQCEAQSVTTADGYFCSDQNPMVAVGLEAPSPKVQSDSACRTEICDYTCNESTFYDPTVCTACACPSGC